MVKNFEKNYVFRVLGLPLFSLGYRRVWQRIDPEAEPAPPAISTSDAVLEGGEQEPIFVINSLMLYRCFKVLTRTRDENLHAVTGSIFENVRYLERIIPLSLSMQSIGGAAAENESLANEFLFLNEFGLRPLAYFHSHPGRGIGGTHPSSTDKQTQSLMEQSGSEIIGGVFSRDGFIRFYANRGEPNVRVVGKRIKEVGKNVYRLEIEENLQA